jgi:5-methylcytosine-specific restriction protein A
MSARPTARQRGYGAAWERARAEHLAAHPYCATCEHDGQLTRAVHVHHSTPHRGNMTIFWDRTRWVSLCQEHHNRDAQQVETRGYSNRLRPDGTPADPRHPFNRGQGDEPATANARHEPSLPPCEGDRDGMHRFLGKGGRSKAAAGKEHGPHGYRRAELVPDFATRGGR